MTWWFARRGQRSRGVGAAALALGLAAACSGVPPTDQGNLGDPVALTLVSRQPTAEVPSSQIVFIANADGNSLRAFLPDTHLFLRAPNAISPRVISLALQTPAGAVTSPSFRPTQLAGSVINGLGYTIVAGASNRVAVVEAQTFKTTQSMKDAQDCASNPQVQDVSCLGVSALDVATTATQAFALLAPDPTGVQHLVTFTPSVENGAPVLTLAAGTPVALPAGTYSGFTVSPDGAHAYVGNRAANQVLDVPLPAGTPITAIPTDAPVQNVVVSPAYLGSDNMTAHPAGELLFAIMTNGRVDILDPVTHAKPIVDMEPEAPIGFATAVQAITFVPCSNAPGQAPCVFRTSPTQQQTPLALGFAALADGTTVPLVPDPTVPTIWRTVNVAGLGPTASTPQPVMGGMPVAGSQVPTTLTIDPASLTQGITRDESYQLLWEGALPGLSQHIGTFTTTTGGTTVTLTDPSADFTHVNVGDLAQLTEIGTDCPAINGALYPVTAVNLTAMPPSLTLTPSMPAPSCLTSAIYSILSAGTTPWVLSGSVTGFVLRTGLMAGQPINTTYPGSPLTRFFYPGTTGGGQAFTFTLTGMDPTTPGTGFSFSTTSGFSPFVVSDPTLSSAGAGLSTSLAATPTLLYIAVAGGNSLTEASLPNLTLAASVTDYL